MENVELKDVSRARVVGFLDWLEEEKGNAIATRNNRLAAIHSFFRYLQYEYSDYLDEYRKIIVVPFKNRNCVSALGPYVFTYFIATAASSDFSQFFSHLCVSGTCQRYPCYWETVRSPRYTIKPLTPRPSFKRRRYLAIFALTNGLCWLLPQ